jgi:hypothetical protein
MWLKFDLSRAGELVSVDEVGRGRTRLSCLYCGGPLTARKGTVKEHHFAHSLETCKPVIHRIKHREFPKIPSLEWLISLLD